MKCENHEYEPNELNTHIFMIITAEVPYPECVLLVLLGGIISTISIKTYFYTALRLILSLIFVP